MTLTIYRSDATGHRVCGDCQLCCKLLPTAEIHKPANERCPHQKVGKGCTIYAHRPRSCALWNCRWLLNDDTADLSRPDRTHYVIDVMPDYITAIPHDGSPPVQVPVLQVWVDPKYPDAHKDPALRAYIARRGEVDGMAALIRFGSDQAFTLVPPALHGGTWLEYASQTCTDPVHSGADLFDFFGMRAVLAER